MKNKLGVRKSGLSAQIIGIAGTIVGLGSGIFTLEEAMLVITAVSVTTNSLFNYLEG